MNVFAYGTLRMEEVWRGVTGDSTVPVAGRLHGYRAYRVAGQVYPAITPKPLGETPGVVYRDVRQALLARLDDFEGPDYERRQVVIECEDDHTLLCQTYVYPDPDRLTTEPWDLKSFLEDGGLKRFLSGYSGFDRV